MVPTHRAARTAAGRQVVDQVLKEVLEIEGVAPQQHLVTTPAGLVELVVNVVERVLDAKDAAVGKTSGP